MKKRSQARARKIRVGDVIEVRAPILRHWRCPIDRRNFRTATVKGLLHPFGGILTDRDLRGCNYWNVADVKLARKRKAA